MKKFILFALITLSIISYSFSIYGYYDENYRCNKNLESIIITIQEEYKKINTELYAFSKKKVLVSKTPERRELFAYYDKNDRVKKIRVTFYSEKGNIKRIYYYRHKDLIFCFQKRVYYNKPSYIEGFEEDKIEENRYYFHNQSLIKWTYKKQYLKLDIDPITTQDRDTNTKEAQKIANELLIEAQEFLNEKFEQQEW